MPTNRDFPTNLKIEIFCDFGGSVCFSTLSSWESSRYGRRYGEGSQGRAGQYFQNIPRIILEIWGRPPRFQRIVLEYYGNIGQLSLGDTLPYLMPYLELSYGSQRSVSRKAPLLADITTTLPLIWPRRPPKGAPFKIFSPLLPIKGLYGPCKSLKCLIRPLRAL